MRRPPAVAKPLAARVLPERTRRWLSRPPGNLHTRRIVRLLPLSPVSRNWGFERGGPVDRHFIEAFLSDHRSDIRGRVLEFADDVYTRTFGGDAVSASDVVDVVEGNPLATMVADITCGDGLEADAFDCIICTQTLQMIFDVRAAIGQLHRMLRPGGVLLVTSHGISKTGRHLGVDPWGEYWHFTTQSMRLLLEDAFSAGDVAVKSYGNVLAATAFLYGVGATEVPVERLDHRDDDFEVIVAARAMKAGG